jgi:hypothetical protein
VIGTKLIEMSKQGANDKKVQESARKPAKKRTPAKKPRAKKQTKPDTLKKEQARTKVAKQSMVEALTKSLGVVTTACRVAEVSTTQHYQWIKDDPEYANKVIDIAEVAKDFVESALFGQIQEGNTTATIFYMKCKMRERGYIEKMDVDLKTGRPDLSDMSTEEIREYLAKKRNG